MSDDQFGQSTSDQELRNFLRESIPEPGSDYWSRIDGHMSQVELETDPSLTRLTPMETSQDTPKTIKSSSRILLAAASVVVLGGLLFAGTQLRSSDDGADLVVASESTEQNDTAAVQEADSTDDEVTEAAPLTDADSIDADSIDADSINADSFGADSFDEEQDGTAPAADADSIDDEEDDTSDGTDVVNAASVLSSAGLGPISVGMSVSELSAVLGQELLVDSIDIPTAGECGWITNAETIATDIWFLVELTGPDDGIIRRVSVTDPRWRTPSNLSVGASEQQVLDALPGAIVSTPHVYVEGNYLTFQPSDPNDPNTVQFVSESGVITEIHVGDKNWVSFVEGCA